MDLAAIGHNVRALRSLAGPDVLFMAVVKADAYGHGAAQVARAALDAGAQRLAVASCAEGRRLRQAGITAPILILGPTAPALAPQVVAQQLTPTVITSDLAQALSGLARAAGVTAPVHIKVDTGMSRYGLLPEDVPAFAKAMMALPRLRLEGLWTHFASAEDDPDYTSAQLDALLAVHRELDHRGIHVPIRHAANSAAAILYPAARLEMVRVGVAMYGMYPDTGCRAVVDLEQAMSLKSTVTRIHWLAEGGSVSYGRTFVAKRPTLVAFVPIGYADGLRRGLSNRGSMLVRGRRAPIIGRVCMDGCMADVTDIPGVQVGDEVVLVGRQGGAEISAAEVAELLGTISYEIVTSVGPRVPRVYLDHPAADR